MKPTSKANYDYVVLQATDNSIPFYESMGFVRVGTVMLEETEEQDSNLLAEGDDAKQAATESPFVTSKIVSYTVKAGETLTRIALKFGVDVWDIIFLNKHILGEEAKPSDKPKRNIILLIPAPEEVDSTKKSVVSPEEIQWHVAKENETPRTIAKKFDISCQDIVDGNKGRLLGLMAGSRLKDGTRIKISHFDIPENEYKAYAHWSFPDSCYEEPEPSYIMARKLNRRKPKERDHCPVKASLKASVLEYEPSPLLFPPSPQPVMPASATAKPPPRTSAIHDHPDKPQPPTRPLTAYMLFATEQRELVAGEVKSGADDPKAMRGLWNDLPKDIKASFEREAATARALYQQEKAKYEEALQAFYASNPDDPQSVALLPPANVEQSIKATLYNKVVRLKEGAMTEGSDYTYYYVMTFIPDLKWCHLAPMIQEGTFGPDKPRVEGRPKWKLVDESLGHEVDISSSYVIPIKSKSMRKTLDADKEEWDIIDDGTDPTKVPAIPPRMLSSKPSGVLYRKSRGTTAVKPSAERAFRKKSLGTGGAVAESPSLLATLPGSGLITTVRLKGKNIFKSDSESPRKRGPSFESKQLSTISEKRASPRKRSSVVRFGSPAKAAEAKKAPPSSIIRKGGRKRKNDGPHVGSRERQSKRRRMADLIDAPMFSSDDDDDDDDFDDAEMSDSSSSYSEAEPERRAVASRRSSPRLNRTKPESESDGSPALRTRRSLARSCSPNEDAAALTGDEKMEMDNRLPKRSTRASCEEPEPVSSLASRPRRSVNSSGKPSTTAEKAPSTTDGNQVVESGSFTKRSTRSKITAREKPELSASPATRPRRSVATATTTNEDRNVAKTDPAPKRSTRSREASLLRESSSSLNKPSTGTTRNRSSSPVAKMVRPKRKSAPSFLGEPASPPPERRLTRNSKV